MNSSTLIMVFTVMLAENCHLDGAAPIALLHDPSAIFGVVAAENARVVRFLLIVYGLCDDLSHVAPASRVNFSAEQESNAREQATVVSVHNLL